MRFIHHGVNQHESENAARLTSRSWSARQGWREDGEGLPTDQEFEEATEKIIRFVKEKKVMHYRNGREAKNGDKIVKLDEQGHVVSFGVLHSAVPGSDFCNGNIAVIQSPNDYACMIDCLHVDDVASILKEKSLEKRPKGS